MADEHQKLDREEVQRDFTERTNRAVEEIIQAMKAHRSDPEKAQEVRYTQGTANSVRDAVKRVVVCIHVEAARAALRQKELERRIEALELRLQANGDQGHGDT